MIAMAITNSPSLLIADEPTTALDVTIQAQVLEVMKRVQQETHAATIMITHDLGIVAEMCDRVLVMYAGHIVESGDVTTIFRSPRHPYTIGLMNSLPKLTEDEEWLEPITGSPPSLIDLPPGCPFHPRCFLAREKCRRGESAARAGRRPCQPRERLPLLGGAGRSQVQVLGGGRRVSAEAAAGVHERADSGDEILRVREPRQVLPDPRRDLQAHGRADPRCRRRRPVHPRRRDARPRGRVRLRQDDPLAHADQADRADVGQDHLQRP